jgi:hypothetical protein
MNKAAAVAWVKRCPKFMPGPSEIEIRPLSEPSDWAAWGSYSRYALRLAIFLR